MTQAASIRTLFFILIILAAVLEASGDIILKQWTINGRSMTFIFGLVTYFAATVVWAFSLKYEFLSKAISMVTILNLIIVVLAGVFLFNESLTLINKAGIALGVLSVIMMEI